ncbi:uncharacterized protein MELLADRAFT_85168 [Melampsora larici-populina 98AG31]|uniref:Uncharacterized protein n=1 Tax=Melampsora larici-populina (strain 98AG31 / pathotype 3-4-7) TaxID=747676 RepID=F4RHR7_MELLP|nr:uncharacterized protein MELLADRAFT_85168 [Melampsora larici-populina 98AG31]EGG07871.1 hypothetical protein MELLADRAFT_85168 [Melampsora larici-populina 98AG31]
MSELVGDTNLAVTGIRATGPSSKKLRAKQDHLTAEELALDDSDKEELREKEDHVRGAEMIIDDSDEEGLPLFDPHSTKPIDQPETIIEQDEDRISSPDATSKIKGKSPQYPKSTQIPAHDPPSQSKPKVGPRTRPASKANIATALNNAASHGQARMNSALQREKIRARSSAAHDARKATRAQEAARLEQESLALKQSATPSLKQAMEIFKADATIQSQDDKSRLAGSKVLRTEDNCAFFIQLEDKLRWPWILEEIELSTQK